ncbi:choice-of-anchor D domain-containing protein [Marinilabiliaceae bacterium JC017]|nr:choice-of-anchor D domain-containing protein [Marinilabiliaceae bacterium JC017]
MKHFYSFVYPGQGQWRLALLFIILFNGVSIFNTSMAANEVLPVEPRMVVMGNGHDLTEHAGETRLDNFTDLGFIEVSKEITRSYTIANKGNAPLHLSDKLVSIRGIRPEDFAVTKQPAAIIEAGQETTFEITFKPSVSGHYGELVGIASNDPDQPHYVFRLAGTGYRIPKVTNVSAVTPDGVYGVGKTIRLKVDFNEKVKVTEVIPPYILLNASGTAKAIYAEGDKYTTLYFDYTVEKGDRIAVLDYLNADALEIGEGTLHSIFFADAKGILTLPVPGTAGSLSVNSKIEIDGIAPDGYTVVFDQAKVTGDNENRISFSIAGGEAEDSYNWEIFGPGADKITGSGDFQTQGNQVTGIDVSAFENGNLTLSLTLTNNLGNVGEVASSVIAKETVVTALSDAASNNLVVYPTTTTGLLTVKADNIDQIIVYSMTGSVVYNKKAIHSREQTIDLSAFDNGIYLVKVESKDNWDIIKVVKK